MLASYQDGTNPLEERPCSAPAVMARDVDAATPESLSAVVSHYDNRSMMHEAAVNPRIPRSRVASRFSSDQHPPRSVASFNALVGAAQKETTREGPNTISLTAAEMARDAHRRYAAYPANSMPTDAAVTAAHQPPSTSASCHQSTSRSAASVAGSKEAAPTAPSLFGRLATMHQGRLAAVSSTVREARTTASLLGAHQEQLERRARAVVVMQRAVRRFTAASRGCRLLGLLHVLRTECVAPRHPLMVQSSGTPNNGTVTPLTYLMELAMEYEYALYVENMAMRLVADTRAADTKTAAVYHQRAMLSEAELSDLHETVQQRLAEGDTAVAPAQLLSGVRSILSPSGARVWAGCLARCCVGHRPAQASRKRAVAGHHLPMDSFLWPVASDAAQQDVENQLVATGRAATPTWSCHSSIAPSASHSSASSFSLSAHVNQTNLRSGDDGWEHPPTRHDLRQARATIQAEQAHALAVTATSDLIQQTPAEWFVGGSSKSAVAEKEAVVARVVRHAGATEAEGLSTMPLPPPEGNAKLPASVPSYNTVERDLEALWSDGRDPELAHERKRAKQLAKRRIMGAEYASEEDEDDRVDCFGLDDPTPAAARGFANAAETQRDEFDSAAYVQWRHTAARVAWAHAEHTVASALQQHHPSNSHRGTTFDPAQWGLDGSLSSMRRAAEIMGASGPRDAGHTIGAACSSGTEADVSHVVLRLGPRGGERAAGVSKSAGAVQPSVCAVCEIDAVDVQLCACGGNWVHRECAFDYDVDSPPSDETSASCMLRCCRLCAA